MTPSPMPSKGQLHAVGLPLLLHDLKLYEKSGILALACEKLEKSLFWKEGNILFARSNYPDDRLAELFLKRGKINFKQYEIAADIFEKTRKKKGAILLEQGAIQPKDLFEALVAQVQEIVLSLFVWKEASYEFRETSFLPPESDIGIVLDAHEMIREGLYHISDWTRLHRGLPPLESILEKNPKFPFPVGRLVSSPEEKEFFNLIDNERSIRDLLTLSSSKALACARILNLFIATDLLRAHAPSLPTTRQAASEVNGGGILKKETPMPILSVKERIQEIEKAYAKMGSQNYYQLLGLTPQASASDIKQAYFALSRTYHPDSCVGEAFAPILPKTTSLFAAVATAYKTLSDAVTRKAYDNGLKNKSRQTQASTPEQTAKEFLDRARAALKQNSLKDAVYFFEEVLRILPEAPEKAAIYLQYGEVLSRVPGRLHEAVDALEKSAALNPDAAGPHIALGKVFSKVGRAKDALLAFQEALKRDPANEAAQDGMRQMKEKAKQ